MVGHIVQASLNPHRNSPCNVYFSNWLLVGWAPKIMFFYPRDRKPGEGSSGQRKNPHIIIFWLCGGLSWRKLVWGGDSGCGSSDNVYVLSRVRCSSGGCSVAQVVVRRLSVRQARVRFSAWHHGEVFLMKPSSSAYNFVEVTGHNCWEFSDLRFTIFTLRTSFKKIKPLFSRGGVGEEKSVSRGDCE